GKALSRLSLESVRSERSSNFQLSQCVANPGMDAAIAFRRGNRIPFVRGGNRKTVGPIVIVGHEAASGRPSHQWPQGRKPLNLVVFLKVSEGSCRFGPSVKPEHRPP